MGSSELVQTDSLNVFRLVKEILYFLNLHTIFSAKLYFPLHFGIYSAKIFVICSAYVCMFEYMLIYKVYLVWNDLFREG